MNYIHKLQGQVKALRADKAQAQDVLTDLVSYLTSPKFHQDTTVQVNDVLTRIQDARSALLPDQGGQ